MHRDTMASGSLYVVVVGGWGGSSSSSSSSSCSAVDDKPVQPEDWFLKLEIFSVVTASDNFV